MKSYLEKKKNKHSILFLILTLLLITFLPDHLNAIPSAKANGNFYTYLPLILNGDESFSTDEKIIGIYMQQYWTDSNVDIYMSQADTLAGKKHAVSGWFIDIQDNHFINPPGDIKTNNLYIQLESLWKQGYVSFVNINSNATAYEIATGKYDSHLRNMAGVYATWTNLGDGRKAFLAPLPEMNGVDANGNAWATYGGDQTNFKLAYQRIQNIFSQSMSDDSKAWWVFAPNGWSDTGHEFENYYPGDELVDVVGFSSYNYGYCRVAIPWERWENYETMYTPYISRIFEMSPTKPIILAQTGTTAQFSSTNEYNINAKNTWLKQNYEYVSKQPQILGILYYDFDQSNWECNWKVTSGGNFSGYKDGAAFPPFRYLTANKLQSIIP